ncbi:MAG: lipase, partial [Mesorhizobium sp.]|nr:lipase [Mesorhizobium sp.]
MRFSGLARAGLLVMMVCVAGLQASVAVARPNAQAHATGKRQPEIYLLRGFGDIFSTGLDEMGERLAAQGIESHVDSHTASGVVARTIIADAQRGRLGPVILIGHSLGANGAIRIAEQLQKAGIKVD